jgi:hypothetical protein
MKKLLLGRAVILLGAIALSACHPVRTHHASFGWLKGDSQWNANDDTPVTVAATLNCPDEEGDLKRTGRSADGKSCQYRDDDDDARQEVTLSLLPLNNQTPQAALAPLETSLRTLMPASSGGSPVNIEAGDGDQDHAKIDLPGLHINANGDKADIRILGADIKADSDKADIHANMGAKNATIHAGPGGAEIRADAAGVHAVQMTFILAGDAPGPAGYHAVGYIARGPTAGPLVVAEFKSKEQHQHGHHRDLDRLIDLNVTPAG